MKTKCKNLWDLDGVDACKRIEKRSNTADIVFATSQCGNCRKPINMDVEILTSEEKDKYVFSAIKTSKINYLIRRHNGVDEYFVFLCPKCAMKNDREELE